MQPAADWTIDQAWTRYTPDEHAVWRHLYDRQSRLLAGRACDEYLAGLQALPIGPDAIPDFERLSKVLNRQTGWRVVAVPGLLPDEVFFDHLANRRFPAGRFIRGADQLDYLQEPDVFHDVFGHLPMLMNRTMADFVQGYGVGGLRARSLGVLPQLARVYWHTVEFGLVRQGQDLRILGAGILSSSAEARFALDDARPHRLCFDLARVMRTRYRIDDLQPAYFVLDSLEQLLELARTDFAPLYQQIAGLPAIEPGALVAGDRVMSRGAGGWHIGRSSAGQPAPAGAGHTDGTG